MERGRILNLILGVILIVPMYIDIKKGIIPNKVIYKEISIGAGSVVVDDIGDNKKAFGIPCKER